MTNKIRRAGTVVLGLALCGFSSPFTMGAIAGTAPKAKPSKLDESSLKGQLLVTGNVTINGKRAITGTTVLNESRINVACAGGNKATVNLGKLGQVELAPGAQLVVRFSEGLIAGELLMGKAIVKNAPGVKVALVTPDGVSAADGKEAAALAVSTQKGNRCVPMIAKGGNNSNSSNASNGTSGLTAGQLAAALAGAAGAGVSTAVALKDRSASSSLP